MLRNNHFTPYSFSSPLLRQTIIPLILSPPFLRQNGGTCNGTMGEGVCSVHVCSYRFSLVSGTECWIKVLGAEGKEFPVKSRAKHQISTSPAIVLSI